MHLTAIQLTELISHDRFNATYKYTVQSDFLHL